MALAFFPEHQEVDVILNVLRIMDIIEYSTVDTDGVLVAIERLGRDDLAVLEM